MPKKYDDLGPGIWRTVGGRRIFIKEGQDLSTAMRESGKFDSIIKETPSMKYNDDVSFICKIRGISEIEKEYGKIKNLDVVLTDERALHITERRGSDAEDVKNHISDTIKQYDYIIDGGKNSIQYIKFFKGTSNYNVIVRLSLEQTNRANSVFTSMKLGDKKVKKYLRNHKVIAKRNK